MCLLIVSDGDVLQCEAGCAACTRIKPHSDSSVMRGQEYRAALILGVSSPDPLDLARAIRDSRFGDLPIAIVASIHELRRLNSNGKLRCRDMCDAFCNGCAPPAPAPRPHRFIIDMRGREILRDNVRLICSPMEFRLLALFLRYPGVIFSRMEVLRRISSSDHPPEPRVIDVLVRRIRSKLRSERDGSQHVFTVHGIGYVFRHNGDVFIDGMTGQLFLSWPTAVTNYSLPANKFLISAE